MSNRRLQCTCISMFSLIQFALLYCTAWSILTLQEGCSNVAVQTAEITQDKSDRVKRLFWKTKTD